MKDSMVQDTANREIGFWRGWSIAVGCAIGSGVFMMPTLLAPYGLLGLGGWLVAGAGTLLVALSLSRLVKRVPKIGGPYAYVNAGLGSLAGVLNRLDLLDLMHSSCIGHCHCLCWLFGSFHSSCHKFLNAEFTGFARACLECYWNEYPKYRE